MIGPAPPPFGPSRRRVHGAGGNALEDGDEQSALCASRIESGARGVAFVIYSIIGLSLGFLNLARGDLMVQPATLKPLCIVLDCASGLTGAADCVACFRNNLI